MVWAKVLLSAVESALLGPSPPEPEKRIELMHALRSSIPSFRSLLSYPAPKASDRAQVQSKEALKLSDDLNLNEINCVSLLVSANQEWGLSEREPLEIYRLTAGLWYSERRDAIASLFSLLQAVVLDQRLEADLLVEIQGHLEDLFNSGLRQRLITLIKELNRDEPAGLRGPTAERYVLDYKGALVEREAVVCRERVGLGHCLVLSSLIVRMITVVAAAAANGVMMATAAAVLGGGGDWCCDGDYGGGPKDVKDVFSILKDCVVEAISNEPTLKLQVMAIGNDINEEGFLDVIRLGWTVHLMLIQDQNTAREALAGAASGDLAYISSCLELICSNNVFQFLLDRILQTAAYQVKQMKDKAMSALSPYLTASSDQFGDNDSNLQQSLQTKTQSFVSLLQLVSEIYQREPELLSGNEVLWTFVNFAGEDHTNIQTLVAFLRMLGTLKFKQALQSTGTMLLDFQEGDAKVLVAYLAVLQKVMENGNHMERKKWFPDIEPLFKLLSYENVPPYLKGAMRNAIASFIHVSPMFKDTIWSFLEQYDLPVVVGPNSMQQLSTQVYDMQFELNEIEARTEKYPSTISFLNLVNALITEERDVSDGGRRFVGIFRFVYDHVFGPFPQRAYADPCEKWQLVIACLQHFKMILSMYDVKDEDIKIVVDQSQTQTVSQAVPFEMQLPVLELLKDFMSGKTVFRNIMGILSSGVNAIIYDRTTQTYGQLLEKAVNLSLDIIILVLERDLYVADFWRPLYQLLYELCCDLLTGGPMIDLLSTRKYRFFCQHLDTIGIAPLPKRNNNQVLRISSLHQEVKVGDQLEESGENVFVGGKNRWKYSTFINWELWWPNFPILNGKQLYDVMVERAGPSKTSGPKED
ncbi:hypothetical protein QJS10_CPB14g01047 [Acorus calamus]|uniref:Uncharacterized protein n=1 Tax=Acorus calamus TaxID=4465 RepID=A0AAV9DAJ8_ACOCL|nr:hypothetical protein QJS10_CPB14g01047 [Acorus calamus]